VEFLQIRPKELQKFLKLLTLDVHLGKGKGKGKAVLEWPRGFQEVRVPRFHDNSTGWW
jgi:hypothetical protein